MPCGYDAERAAEEAYDYADELAELGARRVVAVDAAAYFSRPGPRLVDGLELLAHVLHPDRLPDAPAGPRRDRAVGSLSLADPERRVAAARDRERADDGEHAHDDAGQHRQRHAAAALRELLHRERGGRAPPIRPPRWPPIEMFPITNVSATLIRISGPMPDAIGSTPRRRWSTKAPPMSPNTAPEAPTVTAVGLSSSAPNEPHSSDGEVERHEARVAERWARASCPSQ